MRKCCARTTVGSSPFAFIFRRVGLASPTSYNSACIDVKHPVRIGVHRLSPWPRLVHQRADNESPGPAAPRDSSESSTSQSPKLTVYEDGSAITLSFNDDGSTAPPQSSVFHATWLWVNQPGFVHPSSGQRLTSTPSSAAGWKIRSASVVPSLPDDTAPGFVQPPLGCLHPTGAVYSVKKAENTDAKSTRFSSSDDEPALWVQVEWTRGSDGARMVHDKEELSMSSSPPPPPPLRRVTYHSYTWLQRCRYDRDALAKMDDPSNNWGTARGGEGTSVGVLRHDTSLFEADYQEVMDDDEACLNLLDAVFRQGAALVRAAPAGDTHENDDGGGGGCGDPPTVANLGKRLSGGRLSHGHLYGDTFHVKSVPDAINLAYTTKALPPHQDLAYYQSPPGLQLLHCVSNSVGNGGESTLVDAMSAAAQLQRWIPSAFKALKRCCATFVKQRDSADMVYRAPHIQVVPSTQIAGRTGALNREDYISDDDSTPWQVVSVRWAPPFQGPVLIPHEQLEGYWTAYLCFERMLDNSLPGELYLQSRGVPLELEQRLIVYSNQHTWQRRLREGEILVFNNQRLLHGRRGFRLSSDANPEDAKPPDTARSTQGRHFIGCYTNMEDTLSQYRLLWRHRRSGRDDAYLPLVGNGSAGAPV